MKKLLLSLSLCSSIFANDYANFLTNLNIFHPYVGASVGASIFQDKTSYWDTALPGEITTQNILAPAAKITAGNWFNNYFGIELSFAHLGGSELTNFTPSMFSNGTVILPGSYDAKYHFNSDVLALSFLGGYTFDNHSKVYAKIGGFQSFNKENIVVSEQINGFGIVNSYEESLNESYTGTQFGLGFDYPLTRNIGLTAEYEHFLNVLGGWDDETTWNIGLLSFGVNYKF